MMRDVSTTRNRLLAIASVAAFALLVGATFYRTARVYHVPVAGETAGFGLCDFHNAVYFPGLAYARRENPYLKDYAERYPVNREMSPYSPLLLPFAAVFGTLPLRAAEVVWCVVNVGLMLWLADGMRAAYGARRSVATVFGFGALLVASRAGHSNLILGQVAAPMALATWIALRDARAKPWRSGVALAVATIKPTFGIPLAILMASRGDGAAVTRGVGLAVVLGVASFAWIRGETAGGLADSIRSSHDAIVVDDEVDPTSAWMRTDLMSAVGRWSGATPGAAAELGLMLVLIAPACVVFWRCRAAWSPDDAAALPPPGAPASPEAGSAAAASPEAAWPGIDAILVLTLLPLAIYHMVYDTLVLAPAIGALLAGSRGALRLLGPVGRGVLLVLLAGPAMNYLATYSVMQRLELEGAARDVVVSLNPLALLLAAGIVLWVVATQPTEPATPDGSVTPAG